MTATLESIEETGPHATEICTTPTMGRDARMAEASRRVCGYSLSPSDRFFEADDALVHAFAVEARSCVDLPKKI